MNAERASPSRPLRWCVWRRVEDSYVPVCTSLLHPWVTLDGHPEGVYVAKSETGRMVRVRMHGVKILDVIGADDELKKLEVWL